MQMVVYIYGSVRGLTSRDSVKPNAV